jgi:hypothetical protein
MRLDLRCLGVLGLVGYLLAPVGSAVDAEIVKIPEAKGAPVLLDGLFSPREWDGAWQRDLGAGVKLCLKKMEGHIFVGVRYSPFKGSVADLFISPDGQAIYHLHASAQIGERRVQENSSRWENPEFIWGDTSDWYANEIRWNQKRMDQLIKEGRGRDEAQAMSFYRYDGFEFQIKASKFSSRSWLFRVEASIPPDWERPIVFPVGTAMTKTDGWLRLVLD